MPAALFSPEALRRITDETLSAAAIPEGHRNAVVLSADLHGAQVVAHFKLGDGDHWQLDGVYQHNWTGDNRAGVQLVDSW